jgi:hypothetical protein
MQPGRFYDFLEDVALYSESSSFHLLTLVFPTMRLWSSSTISQMIEWLCDLNRFFGLQPESRYYSPLVQRVRDIESGAMLNSGSSSSSSGSGSSNSSSSSSSGACSREEGGCPAPAPAPGGAQKLLLTGHSLGRLCYAML